MGDCAVYRLVCKSTSSDHVVGFASQSQPGVVHAHIHVLRLPFTWLWIGVLLRCNADELPLSWIPQLVQSELAKGHLLDIHAALR
jgi:hypothetical protein